MALKDLYGIGKGEAQVFNMRGISDLMSEMRQENRDRAARDTAERATKAATLNALDDKLNVQGHHNHNVFLQERLDDIRNFATDMYAKHGEEVFAENKEARAEWENKINDFKKYNQYSKNIKGALQDQINRSVSNDYKMDEASVQAFNEYMDLPLDEQMKRGLPVIGERELSVEEYFNKGGYNRLMDKTAREFGYDTAPSETGDYKRVSGVSIDKGRYEGLRDLILENPNSPYHRAVSKEAVEVITGNGLIPPQVRDPQTGEMVDNPRFINAINQYVAGRTEELMDAYAPKEKVITSKKYDERKDETQEEETVITPMGEDEGGFRIKEKLEVVDKGGKSREVATDLFKGESGKVYFRSAKDMYKNKDGKLTFVKEDAVGPVIPEGTIIDRQGNEADEKYSPMRDVKTRKTGEWSSVKTKETADLSSIPYYISDEGKKVELSGEEGFEKARISELVEDAKYKESNDNIIFEDDPDYDLVDGEEKTGDFVKVKTSKGTKFRTIPYNDEVKEKYENVEKQRSEGKKSKEDPLGIL